MNRLTSNQESAHARPRFRLRTRLIALLCAIAVLVPIGAAVAAPVVAPRPTVSTTVSAQHVQVENIFGGAFKKTRFLLHAGLAFGAFHRYIYQAYKNGDFTNKKVRAFAKAGVAAAFIYHEIKLATKLAQGDPTLSKIAAPLSAIGDKLNGLTGHIKDGSISAADLEGLNTGFDGVTKVAKDSGISINDRVPVL